MTIELFRDVFLATDPRVLVRDNELKGLRTVRIRKNVVEIIGKVENSYYSIT